MEPPVPYYAYSLPIFARRRGDAPSQRGLMGRRYACYGTTGSLLCVLPTHLRPREGRSRGSGGRTVAAGGRLKRQKAATPPASAGLFARRRPVPPGQGATRAQKATPRLARSAAKAVRLPGDPPVLPARVVVQHFIH